MKRAVILLIIFGMIVLGCAEKKPTTEKINEKLVKTPSVKTPTETPTEQAPTPAKTPTPVEDINKTLKDVDELLKELQDIENISFNL